MCFHGIRDISRAWLLMLKNSFIVQTGEGCLELLEVQLEGKKRMDAGSFLRGVKIEKGDCLC